MGGKRMGPVWASGRPRSPRHVPVGVASGNLHWARNGWSPGSESDPGLDAVPGGASW